MFNFAEHHQIVIDILKQSFYHIFRMRIESSPSEMAGFFILTGTNMAEKQIKSRKRVQEHAEVFTAEREVNAMLDLVNDELLRPESTFLEPACGEGNFTVEILRRKLNAVFHAELSKFERLSLVSVASIYAIELLTDNVCIARKRMFDTWYEIVSQRSPEFAEKNTNTVKQILEHNFINGNTLTGLKTDGRPIVIYQYEITDKQVKIVASCEYNSLVNGTLF